MRRKFLHSLNKTYFKIKALKTKKKTDDDETKLAAEKSLQECRDCAQDIVDNTTAAVSSFATACQASCKRLQYIQDF